MDSSKSGRILELYQQFLSGKIVNKQDVAEYYGVNARSIQRDIETIRDFLADQIYRQGVIQSIEYDPKEKGFKLVTQEPTHLLKGEMLAVCKILIESRAFSKEDLTSLLKRLLNCCVAPEEKNRIEWYIGNEIYNYIDPTHPSVNAEILWELAQVIGSQHIIELTYDRLKGQETVTRRIWPVGILFSEYYFYLMGAIDDPDKRKDFEKENDPFPTIYRVDRIKGIKVLDEQYSILYQDRFKEGEYKNRVQYMFGGEIQHIEFKFYGSCIEVVLDRLPTSKVLEVSEGVYTVKAEVFGKGILMWLLSQGSKVEVIGPEDLKTAWLKESVDILKREGKKL